MAALLPKIEIWFIMEVEIPTDPDFGGQDVNPDEVQPGSLMGLQIMLDVALGDAEKSTAYFEEFRRRTAEKA